MFQQPLISAIVLYAECSQCLPNILSGLRQQTYQHIEIIVVDADKSNSNRIDVLAGQYPEVRFMPFFGEASFMPMLAAGFKMIKGSYCFVINTEVHLPVTAIETLLHQMLLHQHNIKIIGMHTSASGYYWRKRPSRIMPWIIRTERILPSQSSDSLYSQAIADSSAFMVSAKYLKEISEVRNFTSEWGIYYWQIKHCKPFEHRGIAPGICIKMATNMQKPKYIFAPKPAGAIALIHTMSIFNPLRYCNYILFYIFHVTELVFGLIKKLNATSVAKRMPDNVSS